MQRRPPARVPHSRRLRARRPRPRTHFAYTAGKDPVQSEGMGPLFTISKNVTMAAADH